MEFALGGFEGDQCPDPAAGQRDLLGTAVWGDLADGPVDVCGALRTHDVDPIVGVHIWCGGGGTLFDDGHCAFRVGGWSGEGREGGGDGGPRL